MAALRSLVAARFPQKARRQGVGVPTGVPAIDEALGDGLPASQLTELVSAAPSSGGQLILAQLLETTRAARQRLALIDAADGFAPHAISPDALRHLVWVRCRSLADALAVADVLVRDGNYAAVVLDLRGVAERTLRQQPGTVWHRLHRVIENSAPSVLALTPCPLIPAVAWRLVLSTPHRLAARRMSQEQLATTLTVEIARGHAGGALERAG
jgi:hypothetical protein